MKDESSSMQNLLHTYWDSTPCETPSDICYILALTVPAYKQYGGICMHGQQHPSSRPSADVLPSSITSHHCFLLSPCPVVEYYYVHTTKKFHLYFVFCGHLASTTTIYYYVFWVCTVQSILGHKWELTAFKN